MKICIDAGHGGSKPGAVFNGLEEKVITLDVALRLKSILIPDFEVLMTRDSDLDVSLEDRVKIANTLNADFYLSLHCNADPDPDEPGMPEANGEEIWYYEDSAKSKMCALLFKSYVGLFFPDEPFRGVKPTRSLYVLSHTLMPAILVEMGFIDNSETNRKFADPMIRTDIANCLKMGCLAVRDYIDKLAGRKL
jgi:N-acetylmuramoyl-L-alanine amidase